MKEWYVRYVLRDSEDGADFLIVLPSFWKLLLWFLRTARNCTHITIFTIEE